MAYLLDTNVFVQARNLYYGMDFCPAFWDWLIAKHAEGQVFSVKKVYDEIAAGNDELVDWVDELDGSFFIEASLETEQALVRVNDWVIAQNYDYVGITEFMNVADCFLVAHALHGKHKVVTLENASNSRRKIKIHDVCDAFEIECIRTFDMLRRGSPRFILEAA